MKTVKKQNKLKHFMYLVIALAMLVYALPMISFEPGAGWISAFGAAWALFAFLVIGAHLHFILGVSEEKQQRLDEVRRAKYREWESKWMKEGKQKQGV